MTPNESVIAKIRKLLNLSQNNPSEEEAALALARAQEMMSAFNLELAEIQAKAPQTTSLADEVGKRVKTTHHWSGLFEYQRDLWKAIAAVNMCYYEAIPEYKTNTLGVRLKANYRHYLIGSEANVMSATVMAEYLEEVIKRLCPYKVGKPMFSWREGCAARLVERLNSKRWEMERESARKQAEAQAANTQTGIVLAAVFQSEEDLNYGAKHGVEALERRLSYRHNQEACMCQYCSTRREQDRRWKEREALNVQEPVKQETDAQRRKREEREARANARFWDAQDRKEERKWAKKDMSAYNEGKRKADDIGLDQQVRGGGKGNLR